jgi:hypothetical protein
MHHREIIKVILKSYKNPIYLELGLFNGDTWNEVSLLAPSAIGVDIVVRSNLIKASKQHKLFTGTTDQFFATLKDFRADVIFIDADHNYKSVKKDFENSLKILNEGGCILLHDTDPSVVEQEAQDRCGDSYRIVDDIEKNPQINIVTIPHGTDGFSIVKRVGETRTQIRKRGNK